ncbi:basic blue protein-like [Cucurbita pepo subsp. pepo]|uniref:basic blue protein-like n=1 Tax=Cucurbita pepo subsp. pepo TaxID=3664 RepID=UPI000C9D9907|nr:basic blue protein-like [Cucurbita pepo subsp. pepo]
MGQGNGSAMALTLLLCLFLIQSEMAQARVYTVGDAQGWTFNVTSWTRGKIFRAGDVLAFNYPAKAHNVVALLTNKVAYNWCLKTRGSKVYQTGKDRIKLVKGDNFFMCSFPGHCKAGMKIAIKAL